MFIKNHRRVKAKSNESHNSMQFAQIRSKQPFKNVTHRLNKSICAIVEQKLSKKYLEPTYSWIYNVIKRKQNLCNNINYS